VHVAYNRPTASDARSVKIYLERHILSANQHPDSSGFLPLRRLTVIDLTLARAGPTCVRHLSDWGANIIRVEPQGTGAEDITGARDGPDFQNLHRNKRTISINLKSPEGHAAFMRLVEKADIVIENMRVAVKHRLKVARPVRIRRAPGSTRLRRAWAV
jgi:crotonobetainyl-CoA:carnitine CoA-transferase CaiB-like acyl-CoA transferase